MRPTFASASGHPRTILAGPILALLLFDYLPHAARGVEPPGVPNPLRLADSRSPLDQSRRDKAATARDARQKAALAKIKESGYGSYTEDPYTGLVSIRFLAHPINPANDASVAMLKPLDTIGALSISDPQMTDAAFDTIATFKTLQTLTIIRTTVVPTSDAAVKKLAVLPRLRHLRIDGSKIGDEALQALGRIRTLESLDLGSQFLTVKGLDNVTEAEYESLANLPVLKELKIAGDSITDGALRRLGQSRSLGKLELNGGKISDEGLAALGQISSLYELQIVSAPISGTGFQSFKSATRLDTLSLIGCAQLNDEGLAAIGGLSPLRSLSIFPSQVSDSGLVHLNGLTNLRTLHLSSRQMTGAGLNSVTALDKLRCASRRPKASRVD